MTDLSKLEIIATVFRAGFENNDLTDAPGFLCKFPEGCCSWASYMMGHFMKYELYLNPIEIQAQRDNDDGTDPHSWLMVGNVIVDITSDEFDDSEERVIVSEYSPWHDSWEIIKRGDIVRIETYDQINYGTQLKPSDVYELLAIEAREVCT